jgi:kinesin family protein C2/C3
LVTGAAFDEAVKINASLSALGDVMAALATNSKGGGKEGHIPYRNSKLTQLLADVLGGQSKVMMFMHVAPEDKSMAESISTLQFGAKVASVTLGAAKKNAAGKGAPQAAPVDDGALKEKESQLRDLAKKLDAEKSAREALEAELQKIQSKASASDDRQLRLTQKELEDATRRLEMEKNQKEMLRAELDKVKKNLKAAISGGKRLYKVSSSVASSRGSFGGGNL